MDTDRATAAEVEGSETMRETMRVLALKIAIDWKDERDKALYSRLRELGWMAAYYRNWQSLAKLAHLRGWRIDPDAAEKNAVQKEIRREKKGDLSGDAYSCAEQEIDATWSAKVKADGGSNVTVNNMRLALAGKPIPQWRPDAALAVSGKEKRQESGVRLYLEDDQYILYLRAQSETSPAASYAQAPADVRARGNGWIRLPVAKHTKRDEWQGPLLEQMVSWALPPKKATVHIEPYGIIVRLTYKLQLPALPPMGERIATLGPVTEGKEQTLQLHLRTETQSRDYSSKLAYISSLKDEWERVKRRAKARIGWRKGHARLKREAIARFRLPDKEDAYIHMWTSDVVDWCATQGVGIIRVVEIATGDWPADRFTFQLKYKAEALGMKVEEGADLQAESSDRAARSAIRKEQTKNTRRRRAVRELTAQLG